MANTDNAALGNMFDDIGGRLEQTIRRVHGETNDRRFVDADGFDCPDAWCGNALDPLTLSSSGACGIGAGWEW